MTSQQNPYTVPPWPDFILKWFDEGRPPHGLRLDDVVIQQQLNVVHRWEDVCAGLSVRDDGELHLQGNMYRQTSNIKCTNSQNVNVSCLVFQLSFPNPMKPGF